MKALIVPDIDGDPGQEPGAIEFRGWYHNPEQIAGIGFRCPCGCKREGYLPLRDQDNTGPSWVWDGSKTAPTLEPSILQVGGCKWHGWLRNGEWVTA